MQLKFRDFELNIKQSIIIAVITLISVSMGFDASLFK